MRPAIQALGHLLTPLVQRFHNSLDHPQVAQESIQAQLCDRLVASDYGAHYGIRHQDDWEALPIVDYDDLTPWVEQQLAHPNTSVLTPDPILFCEKTSGSRGAAKLIPYTKGLRQSFSHLFCVWAQNLIRHGPRFSTGKTYFCISPKLTDSKSFENEQQNRFLSDSLQKQSLQDDSDYLEPWLQGILKPFLVTVPNINQIRSAEAFKQALCLKLLKEGQLEILSIWSPSFLIVQLSYIQQHQHDLIHLLGHSIIGRRREALMANTISWIDIWPHLKLISCWDSATAADQANQLQRLFPGVLIQGKGLLATEAPMTIPLITANHGQDISNHLTNSIVNHVPLLNEVFFEFESIDASPSIYRLHELKHGQDYQIIVSQKGGLYRYRMGDRVRVNHFYRQTPCLQFLGRDHSISDMVGEKLNSDFVANIIRQLPITQAAFRSVVPVLNPHPHYVLLLDQIDLSGAEELNTVAQQLDQRLCQAYHYRQARLLGQLSPAQVYINNAIAEKVIHHRLQSGHQWGDMKHSLLETSPWINNPLTSEHH